MPATATSGDCEPLIVRCRDGVELAAHVWRCRTSDRHGTVIINAATGVAARYYHRYAAFLAVHGFDAITYDYRGIGLSAPAKLRQCRYRWRDWGQRDFDAVLGFAKARDPQGRVLVVGHSFGGFLPGLAESAPVIDRMLTVGAQFGYWRDYAPRQRARLVLKWHVVMPALTTLCGYFPGRRLGWIEDLPAGVVHEWSFRRALVEQRYPPRERTEMLRRLAAVTAPILAVAMTDDALGAPPAIRRALAYYSGARRDVVLLSPEDLGVATVGHFGLFDDRHAAGFWLDTVSWLRDGLNPWPDRPLPEPPDRRARGQVPRADIVRYY